VERGLALHGARRDLQWARLTLLEDRYSAISSGAITAGLWLGHDREAVAVARRLGNEDDYARTLDPLVWRDRAETEDALKHVRTWSRPTAILRGLNVVARDLFFRVGDLPSAADRYREFFAAARRYGSVPDQAEALAQLSSLLIMLGQFDDSRRTLADAQQLVERLGPEHRLHFIVRVGTPTALAYFATADWATLADRAYEYMASPFVLHSPLGLMSGACAALAHVMTGNREDARRVATSLVPLMEPLDPRFYMHNHVFSLVGAVVWELQARDLAEVFLRLADNFVRARVAPGVMAAHELTAARMSALLEDWEQSGRWFTRARVVEDACSHRPGRALVDFDEAMVLMLRCAGHTARAEQLLEAAAGQFNILGMAPWISRSNSHPWRSSLRGDAAQSGQTGQAEG
ncbi:MAG: hypothetical protein JOY61_06815, partial [Chloroflexi bacterium]|nr:hypothetical protein [Chloroflexota bacterium]